MTKKILLASHNAHKKEEFQAILSPLGYEVIGIDDLDDHDDVIEDGKIFSENAKIKAKYYYEKYHMMTISDDSGISIRYLNNFPDIHSARFLNDLTYKEKNELIIKMMEDIKDRYAYYTSAIALIDKDIDETFIGIMEGNIATSPKGENGFGYDPIFIPDGKDMTLAEMTSEEKNSISHRYKAIKGLVDYLAH